MLQAHANQTCQQSPLFKKKERDKQRAGYKGPSAHPRLVLFQGELPSATIIEK